MVEEVEEVDDGGEMGLSWRVSRAGSLGSWMGGTSKAFA